MGMKKGKTETFVKPYECFAAVYDEYMEHVPFETWARYLLATANDYFGALPDRVCDIACGTGAILSFFEPFVKHCFGIDGSDAMLAKAAGRLSRTTLQKGGLVGPFPFEDGAFSWIVCTHDSLNYLTEPGELAAHFAEVFRILGPGGLYSCDFVTINNIRYHHHNRTETFRLSPYRLKWSNRYDEKSRLMVSLLSFSDRGETIYTEEHLQRFYSWSEIEAAARGAGFELIGREGDYRQNEPSSSDLLTNFHFIKKRRSNGN